MDVIYGLLPGVLLFGLVVVGVLFWAARSGQFDDLEGEAHRILMDEDLDDEQDRGGRGKAAAAPRGGAPGEGGTAPERADEEAPRTRG
ncbi:MAG: cbb3-type cytochrome oxidase assembly protein CcoS [Gammaproteobacteria bacterium]|nr:cbb3-type cytochrome oxidase assembly protein CcoS [Gammaproteobacteria bacterium]